MKNILVSVVIPAFNCTAYIEKALDSALLQDIPLEIIVINDCSKDNLDELTLHYSKYSKVRYMKNGKNIGAAETRNRGVAESRGEYIAFLNTDNY